MLSGRHCPQGYDHGEPGTPWRDVRWSPENKQSWKKMVVVVGKLQHGSTGLEGFLG